MTEIVVHFIGLVANVDSTILKLKFKHGFEIKSMADEEGTELFSNLLSLPQLEVYSKFLVNVPCINYSEKKYYLIHNSLKMDKKELTKIISSKAQKFAVDYVQGYLKPIIRLMRLFKEGNICMPLYCFYINEKEPERLMGMGTTRHIVNEPFTLNSNELTDLEKFIRDTKIPFTHPYLQLAFDNFELSYEIRNHNLSFLPLMIALEILFNPGKMELRYRISRNTAVLLGGNNDEYSKKIFSKVKRLYDLRSEVVHTGKKTIIKKDDLLLLRHYVRESIKEIYKLDKKKTNY